MDKSLHYKSEIISLEKAIAVIKCYRKSAMEIEKSESDSFAMKLNKFYFNTIY